MARYLLLFSVLTLACGESAPARSMPPARFESHVVGVVDINGVSVRLSWVRADNATGTHEFCLASTLEGGIASMPFQLCEAAQSIPPTGGPQ